MLIYVTNLKCPSLLEIKALQKKTCRGLPFSIAINGTKQIGNSTIQKLDYRIKIKGWFARTQICWQDFLK